MNYTPRSIRTYALDKLAAWAQQDPAHRDNSLLLEAKPSAWIGGMGEVALCYREDDGTPYFRVGFKKPNDEGPTHRKLDPEGLALIMALCLPPGARLAIEGKGVSGTFYYVRLYFAGLRADGKSRRVHVSPVLADTPAGMHTVEADDYHDLQRRDLAVRERTGSERLSQYGTEAAKGFAKDRWSELAEVSPDQLPETRSERAYADQQGQIPGLYAAFLGSLRRIRSLFSASRGDVSTSHESSPLSDAAFQKTMGLMEYEALLEALHARLKAVPLGLKVEA